jgi:hypothetical protein
MARDVKDDAVRAASEARPDFLRGQLRQWMEQVAAVG